MTPIRDAVTFGIDEHADNARRILEANDFDYAPVMDGDVVAGLLSTQAASDFTECSVGDTYRPLDAELIISGDASLVDTLRWLVGKPFLFILDGKDISGFVTRSDVDKRPGRLFFYLRIVEFEQGLAECVRHYFPQQEDALELLAKSPGRTEVAENYKLNRENNRALDLVAYMQMSQLIRIAKRSDLHHALGYESPQEWKRATTSLISLRNNVMHPVRSLKSPSFTLRKLIQALDDLEDLLSRLRVQSDRNRG